MSTNAPTTDSLPLGTTEPAGKPATGYTKPAAKPSVKPNTKPHLGTKVSPINPDWTLEALEASGYPPAIAEALAPAVTRTISDDIQRKYSTAKIGRFAEKAFKSLRKK